MNQALASNASNNVRDLCTLNHPGIAAALASAIRSGDSACVASIKSAISVLELRQVADWKLANGVPTSGLTNLRVPASPTPTAATAAIAADATPLNAAPTTVPDWIKRVAGSRTTDPALRAALEQALHSRGNDRDERISGVEAAISAWHAKHGLLADKEPKPPRPFAVKGWLFLFLCWGFWVAVPAVIWRVWQS